MDQFIRVQTMWRHLSMEALGRQAACARRQRAGAGLSLLELLVVVGIGTALTVIALPMGLNAMRSYQLSAATSAAAGAIEATRYAAVMHGYPGNGVPGYSYEVTITPATNSYQVLSMIPPATQFATQITQGGATLPTSPIPITSSGGIIISRVGQTGPGAPITFQFSAGGMVTETSTPPNMIFTICNHIGMNTITVSGVGNVSVAFTTPGC